MKYRRLIFANLFRKKTRLALTLGSFAVALFLFGILAIVRAAFSQGLEVAGVDRVVVINKTSIIQPLPLSYRERMLRIPGVKDVTFANWFGGYYQDERNFFAIMAIDTDKFRDVYPEFVMPDDQWRAFLEDREGAIVGRKTANKFGWKVGDRIPIKGTIFTGNWEFNIRAIYDGKRPQDDTTQFFFHWARLNEVLKSRGARSWTDMVGWYTLRISNPDDAARIVKTIDEEFANSPWETKTETEKAFIASWVKQMGNIEFLILTIGGVVFFTLLLVTGNTMAIAVRERTRELAVLKAVGYSDRFVLAIVMAESLLVALVGGALGLGLAKLLAMGGDPTGGMLPVFYLPPVALVFGLAAALLVGLIAAAFPGWSAMRLRVVDALRRV